MCTAHTQNNPALEVHGTAATTSGAQMTSHNSYFHPAVPALARQSSDGKLMRSNFILKGNIDAVERSLWIQITRLFSHYCDIKHGRLEELPAIRCLTVPVCVARHAVTFDAAWKSFRRGNGDTPSENFLYLTEFQMNDNEEEGTRNLMFLRVTRCEFLLSPSMMMYACRLNTKLSHTRFLTCFIYEQY